MKLNLYSGEDVIFTKDAMIDNEGTFNVSFLNPVSTSLSNTTLLIIPEISRIGPIDANNARDVTAAYEKITIVSDSIESFVGDISVVAPGGMQPADGHIWHPGQDIPLRVEIYDDAGLPSKMTLHPVSYTHLTLPTKLEV